MIMAQRFLQKLRPGLIGRTSIVLSGSVLGQGIAFLMLPIITRIYSVDSFGRAATTLAIFNMLAIVVCLQYEQAIIVASEDDLPYLLLLGCIVAMGWFLFIGMLLVISNQLGLNLTETLFSYGVNILLLLLLITYAPYILLLQLCLRQNELSRVSFGRFIYLGLGSILQVVTGSIMGGSEVAFISAQIAATLIAIVFLFPHKWVSQWNLRNLSTREISLGIKRVAKAYNNFPKYQAEAQLANAASIQLPVIFMRFAFTEAWAGWYFLAWRLLAAPVTLISQAVGQVIYRDCAERERLGQPQGHTLENTVTGLIKICLLPATVIGISAPFLISKTMGDAWIPVATIIQILIPAFVISFFTSPISNLLNVKSLQSRIFAIYNLLLFGRIIALIVGWKNDDPLIMIFAYSLVSIMILIPFSTYILRSFGGSLLTVFLRISPTLVDTCLLIVLAILLSTFGILYQTLGLVILVLAIIIFSWREINRLSQRTVYEVL